MLLDDHHLEFQRTVLRLGEKFIAPIADEVDRTDQLPLDVLAAFAENGLVQLVVPEASFFSRLFLNITVVAVQRRLSHRGIPVIVMPVRVKMRA